MNGLADEAALSSFARAVGRNRKSRARMAEDGVREEDEAGIIDNAKISTKNPWRLKQILV